MIQYGHKKKKKEIQNQKERRKKRKERANQIIKNTLDQLI